MIFLLLPWYADTDSSHTIFAFILSLTLVYIVHNFYLSILFSHDLLLSSFCISPHFFPFLFHFFKFFPKISFCRCPGGETEIFQGIHKSVKNIFSNRPDCISWIPNNLGNLQQFWDRQGQNSLTRDRPLCSHADLPAVNWADLRREWEDQPDPGCTVNWGGCRVLS